MSEFDLMYENAVSKFDLIEKVNVGIWSLSALSALSAHFVPFHSFGIWSKKNLFQKALSEFDLMAFMHQNTLSEFDLK